MREVGMPGFLWVFEKDGLVETPNDMRSFLSFVERFGLDRKVFEGGTVECRNVLRGPEGIMGFVAAMSRREDLPGKAALLEYNESTQVWGRFKVNGKRFWIGYEKEGGLPSPDDLRREFCQDGYNLTLSDGNKWLCPAAKALPRRLGLDRETGEFREVVKGEFVPLCEKADRIYEEVRVKGDSSLSAQEAHLLAIECLRLNYHVGLYEMETLGFLSNSDRMWIIRALIDFGPDEKEEESKKNGEPGCG
jgi:hypothetical protein